MTEETAEPTTELAAEPTASDSPFGPPSDDLADDVQSETDAADDVQSETDAADDDQPEDDAADGGSPPPPGELPPPVGALPPPPAAPAAVVGRRLVRDPYSRLGGVASGLAHYFGVDVSIVRIAFVVSAFISGVGLLAYLLAWLIIPRAEHWPPAGAPPQASGLSNREALVAVLVMVGLLMLVTGGGFGANVLVPVLLIGTGVWMLNQPGSESSGQPEPGTFGAPVPPVAQPAPTSAGAAVPPSAPVVLGAPVPRRRRRRGWVIFGVVALLGLLMVPLLIAGTVLWFVTDGRIGDLEFTSVSYAPATVEDLPTSIITDEGDVTLDLTNLEPEDFGDEPIQVRANMSFGELTVIVPDDLRVDVDATADLGDVTVFGRNADGFDPTVRSSEADEHVDLDLQMGLGQIVVERE